MQNEQSREILCNLLMTDSYIEVGLKCLVLFHWINEFLVSLVSLIIVLWPSFELSIVWDSAWTNWENNYRINAKNNKLQ